MMNILPWDNLPPCWIKALVGEEFSSNIYPETHNLSMGDPANDYQIRY